MVRGALTALLNIENDLEVVAEARTGPEALTAALQHKPDVVLTDIEMPGMTGLDLAAALRERGSTARIIILTTFARAGYLRRALEVGASGYLLKDAPSAQLADAVRRVVAGGRAIEPTLATEAWTEPDPLTDRERQVLRLADEGRSGAEIARELNISYHTTMKHVSNIISKLRVSNRMEAGLIFLRHGRTPPTRRADE